MMRLRYCLGVRAVGIYTLTSREIGCFVPKLRCKLTFMDRLLHNINLRLPGTSISLSCSWDRNRFHGEKSTGKSGGFCKCLSARLVTNHTLGPRSLTALTTHVKLSSISPQTMVTTHVATKKPFVLIPTWKRKVVWARTTFQRRRVSKTPQLASTTSTWCNITLYSQSLLYSNLLRMMKCKRKVILRVTLLLLC